MTDTAHTIERLRESGALREALERADRALSETPDDSRLRNLYAELLIESGDWAAARITLLLALEQSPEDVEVLNNLAVLEFLNRQYDEAAAYLTKALNIDPDNIVAHANEAALREHVQRIEQLRAAEALIEQGDFDSAATILQTILQDDENNVDALNDWAVVQMALGAVGEAGVALHKALEIEPHNETASSNLQLLMSLIGSLTADRAPDSSSASQNTPAAERAVDAQPREHTALAATSIVPHGDMEVQRRALESWSAAGFDIVSLNIESDIPTLQVAFPDVRFVAVERQTQLDSDVSPAFFDDFLAFFPRRTADICCIIRPYARMSTGKECKETIVAGLREGVLGWTSDTFLENPMAYPPALCEAICIDRSQWETYPPELFRPGAPWWDYWALLIPLIRQVRVTLMSGGIVNEGANTSYDARCIAEYGARIAAYFDDDASGEITKVAADNETLQHQSTQEYFTTLAETLRGFIVENAQTLRLTV